MRYNELSRDQRASMMTQERANMLMHDMQRRAPESTDPETPERPSTTAVPTSNLVPRAVRTGVYMKEKGKKKSLFFRPSPSRLSPGRNTVFVPFERIVQCLAYSLIGVSKESMDLYAVQHVHIRWRPPKTNKKQQTKQTQQKKPKPTPKNKVGQRTQKQNGTEQTIFSCMSGTAL